jgi:hypothetical protein
MFSVLEVENSGRKFRCRQILAFGALRALCCFSAIGLVGCGSSFSTNGITPIALENSKPGDPQWVLNNPALRHEIEGYASATSVNRGQTIKFFISTMDPSFTFEIFRMGWYQGAGARKVTDAVTLPGTQQVIPSPDPITGLVECRWQLSYSLTVPDKPEDPTDWTSGVYLAKLTAVPSGKQSYTIFVVRDDQRASQYLFQSSVTTYQAYNNWGGKSLYNNGIGGKGVKVSFNRPYAPGLQPSAASGAGAGEFLTTYQPVYETYPAGWEYNMVRFLERNGYDVTYSTDLDTHGNSALLLNHKAFLVVGHDEYWSMPMRNNVIRARDAGVNLAFFAANVSFWQIRFEPSILTGEPDRTQVCYKDTSDPVKGVLATINWRSLGMPEDEIIGVMYGADRVKSDIVVENTNSWVYAGTNLVAGNLLHGLLGYEVDMVQTGSPANVIVLANSPFPESGRPVQYSNMATYTAASGAVVFATGSMHWSWGLDDYNTPTVRPSVLSIDAQKVTDNVLMRFGAQSPDPSGP